MNELLLTASLYLAVGVVTIGLLTLLESVLDHLTRGKR